MRTGQTSDGRFLSVVATLSLESGGCVVVILLCEVDAAFCVDVFSCRILGWRVMTTKTTPLVDATFEQAFFTRKTPIFVSLQQVWYITRMRARTQTLKLGEHHQ